VGSRRSIAAIAAVASLALFAAPAQATFHLQKVNEVMVAGSGGNSAVQFVELFDPGHEPFPPTFGPYNLVIFDAAGNKLGAHMLNGPGMANASSAGRPYLISTTAADAALGVTGDETLDVSLPASAGQACYTAMGETPYSCITWGCISKVVSASSGTGTAQGGAPPAGTSAQRQPDDTIQIAPPTPKAANKAGANTPACPTTGGGGPAPPTFKGVTLTTRQVMVPKSGKAPVGLHCPARTGSCSGRVTLTAGGKKIGSASFKIADGATKLVKVKLSSSAKRTLASKHKLSSKASIKATASGGGTKTTSGKVSLVAAKH
jgi:hypothetical protein